MVAGANAFETAGNQQIDDAVAPVRIAPAPVRKPRNDGGAVSTGGVGSERPKTTTYANGPQAVEGLNGYTATSDAVDKAAKDAEALSDNDQRQAVVKKLYDRPSYTSGEARLDSFLAGTAGMPQVQAVQNNAAGLRSGWNDLLNRVRGNIAVANDEDQRNAKYLKRWT